MVPIVPIGTVSKYRAYHAKFSFPNRAYFAFPDRAHFSFPDRAFYRSCRALICIVHIVPFIRYEGMMCCPMVPHRAYRSFHVRSSYINKTRPTSFV